LRLRFALRRVLALRAHLLAHAVAALVALLGFARLARLGVRVARLGDARLAGLLILALRAHLLAHAVARRVALLAFAGLDRLLVRLLHLLALRGAVGVLGLALVGLGVEAGARREQGGTQDC